jgi:hypothetical protein
MTKTTTTARIGRLNRRPIGRPSNVERITDILHNLNVGEALVTKNPDAYRLAGSISRTTKKNGVRLQVTGIENQTLIEAVAYIR